MAENENFKQIPQTCPPKKLEESRIVGLIIIIFFSSLLISLFTQLESKINILYMIPIALIISIFLLLSLHENVLFRHLVITKEGFYQFRHFTPFSKCDSSFKQENIINWDDIESYSFNELAVFVIGKGQSKRNNHILYFKGKEEILAREILLKEFKKRDIKKNSS
jgi:hypothetical protein